MIPHEFKHIGLVELAVFVQTMIAQIGFVDLFHLRIQAVILKFGFAVVLGRILDIQVHELCAGAERVRDRLKQVIAQFVAKTGGIVYVLIKRYGALLPPIALVFADGYFVGFLRRSGTGFTADLDGAVGGKLPIAEGSGNRAVLIPHLQDALHRIAVDALFLVIIHRMRVDILPGVVGVIGFVPLADG